MRRTVCIVAAALALANCAKPTPYAPAVERYGYAEQQFENNRYRITFAGNSVTERDTVEIYLIYRAAELTRALGYDYFEVADKDTEKSTRFFVTENFSGGFSRFDRRFGHGFGTGFVTGTARPVVEYEGTLNIVVRRGTKPADQANAYDARDVLQRLGPRIQRPPPVAN